MRRFMCWASGQWQEPQVCGIEPAHLGGQVKQAGLSDLPPLLWDSSWQSGSECISSLTVWAYSGCPNVYF